MLPTESANPTSSKGTLAFSDKPFKNTIGVQLPGVSSETQEVTQELIEKNHKNFHIFFNDKNFHNHFVHHLLASYSFGATPEQLRRIYDKYASYQKPKPPSEMTITRENWTEHLGKRDLWTDYLSFFDKIIQEDGMEKVFHTYAFHPLMFPRLFAGIFHPLIHVGYGIEFQLPAVLAEGLAETCIHENTLEKLLDKDFLSTKATEKNKKVLEIIDEVQKDDRLHIPYEEKTKLKKVLAEKMDLVKEMAKEWTIQENEEAVQEATKELYQSIIKVYGATGIRPDKPKVELNFVLMHGLTSMLFIFEMLRYVDLEKRIWMLRSHFVTLLCHYIATGRPKLHVETLRHYEPKELAKDPNPWLDIIRYSMQEEKDAHVIKVIRALLKAQQTWEPTKEDNLYVKIGQITYEGFESNDWHFDTGYEEEW